MRGNPKRPDEKFLWRTKGPSTEYPRGSKIYEGMIAQARVVPVTNEMNGNYVSGCEARVRYVIRVEAENPPPPPTTAPPPQPPPNPTPVDSDLIQTDDCNTPGKGGHDPGMNGKKSWKPYLLTDKGYIQSGWHQHSSDATPRGCHDHGNSYSYNGGTKVPPANIDPHRH